MTTKTMSNVDVKTLCVTLYIAQFFTLRTFIDNAHPTARIIVAEHTFDVITLDLILPDLDGWDILRAIRAEERTRDVPIVVITVVKEQGIGMGFAVQGVLTKPIRVGEVQQTLHSILVQLYPTRVRGYRPTKEEARE